jgi:MoaA/NifB/PqqE/SkfB family radical SAM enzyme
VFSLKSKANLAQAILLKNKPVYVQFYITARCNLTCQQCNIIYANSDVRECTIEEIEKIAQNLAKIGTAIVLLTGGEPFVRKDLPEIIAAFVKNGIHVRMQTNGLASEEMLQRCVQAGGQDISISLDSLEPGKQDAINGGFPGSWQRAIQTISKVTQCLPKEDCFSSFGCVLTPANMYDIEDVLRFGTQIGWYTSLVPIHVTTPDKPMNFRTYDTQLNFKPEHYTEVDRILDRLKALKKEGQLLYDSDEYLEDIKRFIRNEPTQWRRKNDQVCDSPSLYFAILPNGHMAVCCDWRLPGQGVAVQDANFPEMYSSPALRDRFFKVTSACGGCMFGSYPEMTISARYMQAFIERVGVFFSKAPTRPWPLSPEKLEDIARSVQSQNHAQKHSARFS